MNETPLATLTLHDTGSQLQASFVPAAGMLCCSLRQGDRELLAQNAGVRAYAEHGKTMGIPLLYPWANRLAGFEYEQAGHRVTIADDPGRIALDPHGLPIHGAIPGTMRWQPLDAPATSPQALSAQLRWSPEQGVPFGLFPFRHDLAYEARLQDGRLQIAVTVDACGEDVVPVTFGFHPYLSPPDASPRERWQVELPAMRHIALDARQIPLAPEQEQPSRTFELGGQEFDDGFDSLAERPRFAVVSESGRLELEFLEGYSCAQVYAPLSGRFICFEPMTAQTNALISGAGLRLLAPGETHRASFSVRAS